MECLAQALQNEARHALDRAHTYCTVVRRGRASAHVSQLPEEMAPWGALLHAPAELVHLQARSPRLPG
eukprot:4241222-Heterocapsa_arctica.AAC.1